MKVFKDVKLGDRLRDASDRLRDMPDDTGDPTVHLSLTNAGKVKVVKEIHTEDDEGIPKVEETTDNILQESRFDTFIHKLETGIVDPDTSYNLTDVVNLILELAYLCKGAASVPSRASCEEKAQQETEEQEEEQTPVDPGE